MVSRLIMWAAIALFPCIGGSANAQQQNCASPATLERIKSHFVSKATSDVAWWLALKINAPQYRMKDVRFEFEALRQIGTTYAGTDCQGVVKLFCPPDVVNANAVQVSIKYVVLSDGGIDLYQGTP